MKLYDSLQSINLTNYINFYFSGKDWKKNKYLESLDSFVKNLSIDQRIVLRDKFKSNKITHLETQSLVNEIAIARVFHPQAEFIDASKQRFDLIEKTCL